MNSKRILIARIIAVVVTLVIVVTAGLELVILHTEDSMLLTEETEFRLTGEFSVDKPLTVSIGDRYGFSIISSNREILKNADAEFLQVGLRTRVDAKVVYRIDDFDLDPGNWEILSSIWREIEVVATPTEPTILTYPGRNALGAELFFWLVLNFVAVIVTFELYTRVVD